MDEGPALTSCQSLGLHTPIPRTHGLRRKLGEGGGSVGNVNKLLSKRGLAPHEQSRQSSEGWLLLE